MKKAEFYELSLCPTIATLLPGDVSDWPPTYESKVFQAKKTKGLFSYQTKIILWTHIEELAETLHARLTKASVDWADRFFFTHMVHRVKHSTQHQISIEAADSTLRDFLYQANVPETSGLTWEQSSTVRTSCISNGWLYLTFIWPGRFWEYLMNKHLVSPHLGAPNTLGILSATLWLFLAVGSPLDIELGKIVKQCTSSFILQTKLLCTTLKGFTMAKR